MAVSVSGSAGSADGVGSSDGSSVCVAGPSSGVLSSIGMVGGLVVPRVEAGHSRKLQSFFASRDTKLPSAHSCTSAMQGRTSDWLPAELASLEVVDARAADGDVDGHAARPVSSFGVVDATATDGVDVGQAAKPGDSKVVVGLTVEVLLGDFVGKIEAENLSELVTVELEASVVVACTDEGSSLAAAGRVRRLRGVLVVVTSTPSFGEVEICAEEDVLTIVSSGAAVVDSSVTSALLYVELELDAAVVSTGLRLVVADAEYEEETITFVLVVSDSSSGSPGSVILRAAPRKAGSSSCRELHSNRVGNPSKTTNSLIMLLIRRLSFE